MSTVVTSGGVSARNYNQNCPIARGLDALGERWTLLILRELLGGPRRYGDLRAELPGIATNLLAVRLREPMAATPEVVDVVLREIGAIEQNIRDTLATTGWRINFLGPTTYLGNTKAFTRDLNEVPGQLRQQLSPQTVDQMRGFSDRFSSIAKLIDDDQVYLPFTVVHAERVD